MHIFSKLDHIRLKVVHIFSKLDHIWLSACIYEESGAFISAKISFLIKNTGYIKDIYLEVENKNIIFY